MVTVLEKQSPNRAVLFVVFRRGSIKTTFFSCRGQVGVKRSWFHLDSVGAPNERLCRFAFASLLAEIRHRQAELMEQPCRVEILVALDAR
jgi:hypothetical protein